MAFTKLTNAATETAAIQLIRNADTMEVRGMNNEERRWNSRKPIDMNVSLYYGGLGLLQCKVKDISLNGIYVETGRIMLSQDTSIELVFTGYTKQASRQHRINAQIARVDRRGAGLAFNNLELGAYRFLQELLEERKKARH